jgi:hypothetical protein
MLKDYDHYPLGQLICCAFAGYRELYIIFARGFRAVSKL